MNSECSIMENYIIQYINNTIKEENKLKLASHLRNCPQCREELGMTLKLSEIISKEIKEPPEGIIETAFSMIPRENEIEHSITFSDIKSSLEPLKIIPYSLSIAKKSINLALQFI